MRDLSNILTDIKSQDFELLVTSFLKEAGNGLTDLVVTHDTKQVAKDGAYQIDVIAKFKAFLDAEIVVVVECKHHKTRVKRGVVLELCQKLASLGAHKGMVFSSSGFQKGAVAFAAEHGIALIHVIRQEYTFISKAGDTEEIALTDTDDDPQYVGVYDHVFHSTNREVSMLQQGYLGPLSEYIFGVI